METTQSDNPLIRTFSSQYTAVREWGLIAINYFPPLISQVYDILHDMQTPKSWRVYSETSIQRQENKPL